MRPWVSSLPDYIQSRASRKSQCIMCRLLCVRSDSEFSIDQQLKPFAQLSQDSREYQGHGWGCSWRRDGKWHFHHDIRPVWEDDIDDFGETNLLIAHARSAFRDEGIVVENNMPFTDGNFVFVFNGELRGVRIKEQGRIGAEKLFNTIKRFDKGNSLEMMTRGMQVIDRRTRYVRAMNIILSDGTDIVVGSQFGEDPEYFQMQQTVIGDRTIVCSEVWPGEDSANWKAIDNGSVFDLGSPG